MSYSCLENVVSPTSLQSCSHVLVFSIISETCLEVPEVCFYLSCSSYVTQES